MLEDFCQQVRKYGNFLSYPELDLDSLYIRGYADASFGMNVDGSGQIGYCILLMDKFDRFAIIKFFGMGNVIEGRTLPWQPRHAHSQKLSMPLSS
jgi:hypothetical protein